MRIAIRPFIHPFSLNFTKLNSGLVAKNLILTQIDTKYLRFRIKNFLLSEIQHPFSMLLSALIVVSIIIVLLFHSIHLVFNSANLLSAYPEVIGMFQHLIFALCAYWLSARALLRGAFRIRSGFFAFLPIGNQDFYRSMLLEMLLITTITSLIAVISHVIFSLALSNEGVFLLAASFITLPLLIGISTLLATISSLSILQNQAANSGLRTLFIKLLSFSICLFSAWIFQNAGSYWSVSGSFLILIPILGATLAIIIVSLNRLKLDLQLNWQQIMAAVEEKIENITPGHTASISGLPEFNLPGKIPHLLMWILSSKDSFGMRRVGTLKANLLTMLLFFMATLIFSQKTGSSLALGLMGGLVSSGIFAGIVGNIGDLHRVLRTQPLSYLRFIIALGLQPFIYGLLTLLPFILAAIPFGFNATLGAAAISTSIYLLASLVWLLATVANPGSPLGLRLTISVGVLSSLFALNVFTPLGPIVLLAFVIILFVKSHQVWYFRDLD
jgi:hypothetical protein